MRTVYTEVMKRLQSEVPVLNGIELDFGQLKRIERGETLPVTYPYAFVGISIPECLDITEKIQDCKGIVSIMLAFDPFTAGETSSTATEEEIDAALTPYDTISDVYRVLQGYETEEFSTLSRISQGKEDYEKLFVYRIDFSCEFEDLTAMI